MLKFRKWFIVPILSHCRVVLLRRMNFERCNFIPRLVVSDIGQNTKYWNFLNILFFKSECRVELCEILFHISCFPDLGEIKNSPYSSLTLFTQFEQSEASWGHTIFWLLNKIDSKTLYQQQSNDHRGDFYWFFFFYIYIIDVGLEFRDLDRLDVGVWLEDADTCCCS